MADPQTNLRSFILADWPELAAFFDSAYSYCGNSNHNQFNAECCSYPDKALLVDEKLQKASLVHILYGWAYQPGSHMRGLGGSAWETIQKAIKEQDEARVQAKIQSRALKYPSQVYSQRLLEDQCRSLREAPVTPSPQTDPPNVLTDGLRQLHEKTDKARVRVLRSLEEIEATSAVPDLTQQPVTTNQPPKSLPSSRTYAAAPAPVVQNCRQKSALSQAGEKPREFFCDLFKKLDIAMTNELTTSEHSKASMNIPIPTPAPGSNKQASASTCEPSIDHQRRFPESKHMAKNLQPTALEHRKALATTSPLTLSSAVAKKDQNVEKEWELVQENPLKEDYVILWPMHLPKTGDKEWELVRAESVEEDHVMVWP